MAAIKDLLNPITEDPDACPSFLMRHIQRQGVKLSDTIQQASNSQHTSVANHFPVSVANSTQPSNVQQASRNHQASNTRQKKPKGVKDAPIFRLGPTTGVVRYAPHEARDQRLTAIYERFRLYPMNRQLRDGTREGNIVDYPRPIPYQSEKKDFYQKTGRDSFHVFQYTFSLPGSDDKWTVMWDYNIGLVRTTHLFKCMEFAKARILYSSSSNVEANEGLRDICHSITGGALAAQGYWMPFEAAKYVASRFCWDIKEVLIPMFGHDFPDMCQKPKERTTKITIPQTIICTERDRAREFRRLEMGQAQAGQGPEPAPTPAPVLPRTSNAHSPADSNPSPPHYESRSKYARNSYSDSVASARGSSSGPSSEASLSPVRGAWNPVNAPHRAHGRRSLVLRSREEQEARRSQELREFEELDEVDEGDVDRDPGFRHEVDAAQALITMHMHEVGANSGSPSSVVESMAPWTRSSGATCEKRKRRASL
ncbi:hypothetical protein N7468_009699 [Penicillium chermesinum]|uniref:HTH APSES-type domain-containing protein n=1 Tax=Penicillium chermesinum TaxID=63820 RepID=A0A9W9NIA9_9EURO|nr:uncharacterized protein N7468_009699 [Penicillium chermesinum]KAJ5220495.1 hypothetical protein N7468_009699 [Penicillium chermesinum]KAJ6157930.1 hypothetical protein N7470_005522 [Penicillium chermesinum]